MRIDVDSEIKEIKSSVQFIKQQKALRTIVQIIFFMIVFLGLDQIVNEIDITMEDILIIKMQKIIDINYQNIIFYLISSTELTIIILMLFKHILASIFVWKNAIAATQVVFISTICIYCVSIIVLLYSGPRPFWTQSINTAYCIQTFGHPNLLFYGLVFIYVYYKIVFSQYNREVQKDRCEELVFKKQNIQFGITFYLLIFVFTVIFTAVKMLLGQTFIINTLLSLFCLIFSILFLQFYSIQISRLINKTFILYIESKKLLFYYLMIFLVMQVLIGFYINYDRNTLLINAQQIFFECVHKNKQFELIQGTSQASLIGSQKSYEATSIVFDIVGYLFSIPWIFRKYIHFEWNQNSNRHKLIRLFIVNGFLVLTYPILFFRIYFAEYINTFMFYSLYNFITTIIIYKTIPLLIFKRLNLIKESCHEVNQIYENQKDSIESQDDSELKDSLLAGYKTTGVRETLKNTQSNAPVDNFKIKNNYKKMQTNAPLDNFLIKNKFD